MVAYLPAFGLRSWFVTGAGPGRGAGGRTQAQCRGPAGSSKTGEMHQRADLSGTPGGRSLSHGYVPPAAVYTFQTEMTFWDTVDVSEQWTFSRPVWAFHACVCPSPELIVSAGKVQLK